MGLLKNEANTISKAHSKKIKSKKTVSKIRTNTIRK